VVVCPGAGLLRPGRADQVTGDCAASMTRICFEAGEIADATNGQSVVIRDENGRPMLGGAGRPQRLGAASPAGRRSAPWVQTNYEAAGRGPPPPRLRSQESGATDLRQPVVTMDTNPMVVAG